MRYFCMLFIFLAPLGFTSFVHAQDDHSDHFHEGGGNEIGGALGVVFNITEQHTASGFHFHYTRMFGGKLHHFGIAPGIEFIIGDDNHYTLHLMAVYRPIHGWWLGAGPGITYFEHDYSKGFSGHIETGYEFEAGSVHFGPVIEFSWAEYDQHVLVGIHLGIPF